MVTLVAQLQQHNRRKMCHAEIQQTTLSLESHCHALNLGGEVHAGRQPGKSQSISKEGIVQA